VPETTARRVVRTMAIKRVALTDPWAERELAICIRSLVALPAYAQELVQHLRADGYRTSGRPSLLHSSIPSA
jgi:phosphoserine phosphatase